MPIYEYRCTSCGKVFEEWVKGFDTSDHEPCPVCGADAARIMSRTSFVLEGSGWYVTEYGNRKVDHESGAGAPNEGHGELKESSETKPDSADSSSAASPASDSSPVKADSSPVTAPPAPEKTSPTTGTAA